MFNRDTEILFPTYIIPELHDLRGDEWKDLIQQVEKRESSDPKRIAFTLMMVQINNCVSCQADSYRALKGCVQCARQNIERLRGDHVELVNLFKEANEEISNYIRSNPFP